MSLNLSRKDLHLFVNYITFTVLPRCEKGTTGQPQDTEHHGKLNTKLGLQVLVANPTARLMPRPEAADRQYSLAGDYCIGKSDFCVQSATPGEWEGRASWKHKWNVGGEKFPQIQREWLAVLRGLASEI